MACSHAVVSYGNAMTTETDITIDGSQGEGGGQILRSSVALSAITGKSLRVVNIRAGRKKPGLMRQHLTSVQAAAQICNAEVIGATAGASEITFLPQEVQAGCCHLRVGTAGSAMLVLQTVVPPLLTADAPSTVTVEGGTHNMMAPPFDFLARSWVPLIERMGPCVSARIERYGFYPAGGGRVVCEIAPSPTLAGFDLLDAGRVQDRRLRVLISNLSRGIAEREIKQALRKLNWPAAVSQIEHVESNGPGNVLLAELECENVGAVFCGFGKIGVRAEQVADGVVRNIRSWMKSQAPVGPFLADQLMLPLAISAAQSQDCSVRRGGSFLTGPLTEHSRTQMELLPVFLPVSIEVSDRDNATLVTVRPADNAG
jgi:RNA 3'-terminal phosphate cyclase (ATP)